MDPELSKMLRETFKLTVENNKMLHKVRSVQKREDFIGALKWIVIILVGVGSFYFLQPYIDFVQKFIQSTNTTLGEFNTYLDKNGLKK